MNQKSPARRPGDREKKFGDGGEVTLSILPEEILFTRLIKGVLVLPDNTVLLSVTLETSGHIMQYGLMRLTSDGKLDTSFINRGLLIDHFKGNDACGGGRLLRLVDGRLLMLGSNIVYQGPEPVPHLAMACYSDDYTLDVAFGGSGTGHLVIDNQPNEICITDVSTIAQQADGKLLICTTYHKFGDLSNTTGVLYRLNLDGTRDITFGKSGRLDFKLQDPDASTALFACLPQYDKKIVVAGYAHLQPDRDTALIARLDDKGGLDQDFGDRESPGYFSIGIGKHSTRFNALLSTNDGFVGLGEAGDSNGTDTEGLLVGITKDGVSDFAFNGGKPLLTKYHPERNNAWLSGYVQSDGKFVATATRHYIYIARWLHDGTPDWEFGIGEHISEDSSNAAAPAIVTARPGNGILLGCNPTGIEGGLGKLFAYLG